MIKIGDKIKIIHLTDELFNSNYQGKEGKVTKIQIDAYGKIRISGTWGGIFIYPNEDNIEVIK